MCEKNATIFSEINNNTMRFKKNKKSFNPRYFLLEQLEDREMVDGDGNTLQYNDPVLLKTDDGAVEEWILNSEKLETDGKVEIKRDTKYGGETMDIEPIHLTLNL